MYSIYVRIICVGICIIAVAIGIKYNSKLLDAKLICVAVVLGTEKFPVRVPTLLSSKSPSTILELAII